MPSTKRIVEVLGKTIEHSHGDTFVLPIALFMNRMMDIAKTHDEVDHVLDVFNNLLYGYGVEAIRGPHVDGYYMDINLLYINMGDTYSQTIVFDTLEEQFHVCSWGDIVEAQPKRFAD